MAQEFNVVTDQSNFYPSASVGNFIPPSDLGPNYAILAWTHVPSQVTSQAVVTNVKIIPSVSVNKTNEYHLSNYGWYNVDEDTDSRTWYTIIDSDDFFTRTTSPPSVLLTKIQSKLTEINLGTVEQRKNYIYWLNNNLTTIVNPVDFRGYIQPWIIAGLVIAILIPAWYLMRRFLRG